MGDGTGTDGPNPPVTCPHDGRELGPDYRAWVCPEHGVVAYLRLDEMALDGPDEVQVATLLRLCADALDALDRGPAEPPPPRNPTPPVGAGLPLRRVTDSPQA